jgi:hypothetical protein
MNKKSDDLKDIKSFLKTQGDKRPVRAASAFGTIKGLLQDIITLKRKRFTDREICDLLAQKNIIVSLGTFQQYVSRAKRMAEGDFLSRTAAHTPHNKKGRVESRKREPTKDKNKASRLGHRLNEDL